MVEPDAVDLNDRRIDEGWLQDLLHRNPGLLPIDEIGPAWGPLISLGREIPTAVGSIDNLFVSPNGELAVVETKLWRNPESRRKVVGQLLDYASCLAGMSFEELNDAVSRSSGGQIDMWEAASQAGGQNEADFHDVIAANLSAGRFLLLIVGDGIRADLEAMADLLTGHPTWLFTWRWSR